MAEVSGSWIIDPETGEWLPNMKDEAMAARYAVQPPLDAEKEMNPIEEEDNV